MKMKKWMTQKAHQNSPKVSHGVNACIETHPLLCAGNGSYYSARLYRDLNPSHEASAVFCMCLYHPMYIQVCLY